MQATKIKKLSRIGLVVGAVAFVLSLVIGFWSSSTFLSAIGTILLFVGFPLILCSVPVFIITYGSDGLRDENE